MVFYKFNKYNAVGLSTLYFPLWKKRIPEKIDFKQRTAPENRKSCSGDYDFRGSLVVNYSKTGFLDYERGKMSL